LKNQHRALDLQGNFWTRVPAIHLHTQPTIRYVYVQSKWELGNNKVQKQESKQSCDGNSPLLKSFQVFTSSTLEELRSDMPAPSFPGCAHQHQLMLVAHLLSFHFQ